MVTLINERAQETNPKGRLQRVVLRRSGMLPRYRVLEQSGSNNDRVFTVGVFEQDLLLGLGKASSIKEAGRLAASEALEILRIQEIEEHEHQPEASESVSPQEIEGNEDGPAISDGAAGA
jgi:ribonuclease-3